MTDTTYDHLQNLSYDREFEDVRELNWKPWVGADYEKTRIFILGKSTYYHEGDTWQKTYNGESNRELMTENACGDDPAKPFATTFKIFAKALDKEDNLQNRKAFWSSFAFANHCQNIVQGPDGECDDPNRANEAFRQVVDIIKPDLVIIWGTQIWKFGLEVEADRPKIGKDIPRILSAQNGKPAYVGILHPSWMHSPSDWYEFLADEPVSKPTITKLTTHLKRVLK